MIDVTGADSQHRIRTYATFDLLIKSIEVFRDAIVTKFPNFD
jgi:hypothetical protein